MDKKDKDSKGGAATASKMAAASKKQVGDEAPAPGQGATSSQNQGGTQNTGATGTQNQSASITPQQHHGAVGSQPNQGATGGATGSQQNQGAGGGQNLMQQAKQTTSEVVNQVQQQASTQINRQKETAASELSTVVNAVRRFGETLSQEEGPIARFAAQYGDKAANSLDKFATYLREQDPKRLLNDVQNFGRRQPALMIGGMFLLGFAGARLIRSTMEAASTSGSGSMSMGTQGSRGMGGQSLNTNVSGAQPSTPPNTI